jgi:hypothetical protein
VPIAAATNTNVSQIDNQRSVQISTASNGGGVKIVHETPLTITLDLDGATFVKKLIKIMTEEQSNSAGVLG